MQVGSCDKCQRTNRTLQKGTGVLHPIPVRPKLWHQVGMDLVGPLPESSNGNKYIIILTDYFSKWAEAGALPDKTAHGIAKFIYSVVSYSMIEVELCYSFCNYIALLTPNNYNMPSHITGYL